MLLQLAYLGVTNVFALLRLLSLGDRDKEMEILALRHQIAVLERQLGRARPRFLPADRALLAALLNLHVPKISSAQAGGAIRLRRPSEVIALRGLTAGG